MAQLEPVSLAEAKLWCRITHDEDDALIAGLISSGRQHVENATRRRLITTTLAAYADDFPAGDWKLPGGTLQTAGMSITYVDTAGATQTVSSSVYGADTTVEPGLIYLKYNQNWPNCRGWHNDVTVTYKVGYGDDPHDVPELLRVAIKQLVAHGYENREALTDGVLREVPLAVDSICWQYALPEADW